MSEPSPHPTREELSAYSLGQLPQERAVAIDSHISECQPCCETIVGISSDDTFVGLLQEARQLPADQTVDHGNLPATRSSALLDVPAPLAEHPRYEIVRLIGKGGMGDVYEAIHRKMERTVALKVLNRELFRKTEAVNRFHREVKTAAQLSHPNIVTSHDADQAGDYHFMVMEYVDGTDLSQIVKEQGALPVAEACGYIRQAAIGLQHAHEQGMVHRDIKPHNLMVTADGTVKVLDFGLASLAPEAVSDAETGEARGDLTAAGAIMGTPDFISPEQANDARQADIRSDIYSLGASLYFLLSGRPPFAEGSVMHKLKSHAESEPEPLESLRDDVPDELVAIVTRMMAKDPAERFQTPAEVAAVLKSFSRSAESRKDVEPRTQAKPRRWKPTFVSLTTVAALFVAAFLAGLIYYLQTDHGVVRVEVTDPSLQVSINDHTITMKDGDEKTLTIRPGDETLIVRKDNADFEFETDRFQIRRGDRIAFKVEMLQGEIVVRKDGEKFNSKVLPDDDKTQQILDRMLKAYAECKSYRDSGGIKTVIVENTVSPKITLEHSFTTVFVRPDRFRFEIKDEDDDRLLISANGQNVYIWWDVAPGIQEPESLEFAIAQAFGFSGGDVGRIAAMLMPQELEGWGGLDIIDPKQIEDGNLQDVECFRLEYNFRDEQITLWIDKQSYLVRRIDERIKSDGIRTERTTTYQPTIDGKISEDMLKFDPPANKASALLPTEVQEPEPASSDGTPAPSQDLLVGEWVGAADGDDELRMTFNSNDTFEMVLVDPAVPQRVKNRTTGTYTADFSVSPAHLDLDATIIYPAFDPELKTEPEYEGSAETAPAEGPARERIKKHKFETIMELVDASTLQMSDLESDSRPKTFGKRSVLLHRQGVAKVEKPTEAAPTSDEAAAAGAEQLQGPWQVLYMEENGNPVPDELAEKIVFVIKGDQLTTLVDGKESQNSTFTLDPVASPSLIDLVDNENEKLTGIYELQGDVLRICLAQEKASERPQAFASDGKRVALYRLKRMKSKDQPRKESYYPAGNINIKSIAAIEGGKVRITYTTMPESAWFCPGANAKVTEQGVELTFVRAWFSKRPKVDYPAAKAEEGQGLERVIIVQPEGKPIFIRSETKLKQIWSANGITSTEEQSETDRDRLQGIWQVISVEDKGGIQPQEMRVHLTFANDNVTYEFGDSKRERTYRLDPSASPKSIDITEGNVTLLGIYDLEGDTLKLCYPNSEQTHSRPNVFKTKVGEASYVVMKLKRVAESAKPGDAEPVEQIALLFGAWKKLPDDSEKSAEFAERVISLHHELYKNVTPNTERHRQTSRRLASVCWPHLSDAIPKSMAQAVSDLTKPDASVRISDRLAEEGRPTEPVGWDVQAVHALALARAGKTDEALQENDALIKKIDVNVRKGRLPDVQSVFLGTMRSQKSLLQQSLLQKALILAIAGKTVDSVDASTAAGRVEVTKPTKEDQSAIQAIIQTLGKAAASPADDANPLHLNGLRHSETRVYCYEEG